MPRKPLVEHTLIRADNLAYLKANQQGLKSSIDFMYIDPAAPPVKGFSPGITRQKHQRWADTIHPRLVAAAPLLKDTGVIAATTNDNELPRLRILMDDVYGEENFIGMMVIDSGNVYNNARLLSVTHEYLLLYAKNMKMLMKAGVKWRQPREGLQALRKQEKALRKQHGNDFTTITAELKQWLKEQNLPKRLKQFYNADERGLYSYSDLSAPGKSLYYDVIHPLTGKPVSIPTRGWGWTEENLQALIDDDMIIWGETEKNQPLKKLYLNDDPDQVLRGVTQYPVRNQAALIKRILGPVQLPAEPQSLEFMKSLIRIMTPKNAIIMDFYAGTGTTGHAVLDINYEDSDSSRSVILVSNNEKSMFSSYLKPRMQAVVTGKWYDKQHHPRRATLNIIEHP